MLRRLSAFFGALAMSRFSQPSLIVRLPGFGGGDVEQQRVDVEDQHTAHGELFARGMPEQPGHEMYARSVRSSPNLGYQSVRQRKSCSSRYDPAIHSFRWLRWRIARILNSMHSLPIPHFQDLAIASGRSPAELERELRLLLAVKLFELKRVSTGQAADIAGLSRFAFLDELAKMGVAAIDFDPSEAEHEFGDAR